MEIEEVSIDELIPDAKNARKHSKANLDAIRTSLQVFGQQKPIVVNSDNVVIAGNGFLAAAKDLGWKSIKVVRTTLDDAQAVAYAIADNRTAELAEWDMAVLNEVFKDMEFAMQTATGWTIEEVSGILRGDSGTSEYKPILTPEFSKNAVSNRDMTRAHSVFDVAKDESPKVPVICPHCGEEFEIDRPA